MNQELLERYDPVSDAANFGGFVRGAATALHFTDLDLAILFDVSRSSVNRWMNGEVIPQLAIRKLVKRKIQEKISENKR